MGKQKKGAFFYYMLEYKKKKGLQIPLKHIAKECSHLWANLTAEKKLIYQELARNTTDEGNPREKFTSQGLSLSLLEKKKQHDIEIKKILEMKISEITEDSAINNIYLQDFFFISFNYFCQNPDQSSYIPAEIGLLKYNLQNGIVDTYNQLINPGKLPSGMPFTAKTHSEQTHKLPIPPDASGEKDYKKIFKKIYDFVYDNNNKRTSPLITSNNHVTMVNSILKLLCWDSDYEEETFTVLPLTELFFSLKRTTAKKIFNADGFSSVHSANTLIERDIYQQSTKSCDVHEEMDNGKFCTKSQITRWAYTISDHCCLDLGITLIPGKHVPLKSDTLKNCVQFTVDNDAGTSSSSVRSSSSTTFSIPIDLKTKTFDGKYPSDNNSAPLNRSLYSYRDQDNNSPQLSSLTSKRRDLI